MIEMFSDLLLSGVRIDLVWLDRALPLGIGPIRVMDVQVYYNTQTFMNGSTVDLGVDMMVCGRA